MHFLIWGPSPDVQAAKGLLRNHSYTTLGHKGGGSKNGNFPLRNIIKMSLRRRVGGLKKL